MLVAYFVLGFVAIFVCASKSQTVTNTSRGSNQAPMSFNFRLPTTGSLLFANYIKDDTGRYGPQLSEATAQRGRVRAILKDSKHSDGPNDYVKIIKVRNNLYKR